jgi:uncharacterized membrane protein
VTERVKLELSLIGGAVVLLAALLAFGEHGLPWSLAAVRIALAFVVVLFIPGYALQSAVFPRRHHLDDAERLAFSLVLSIACIPPAAFVIDKTGWGIELWTIFASQCVIIFTSLAIGIYRRRDEVAVTSERLEWPKISGSVLEWWERLGKTGRVLYGAIVLAVVVAVLSASAIVLLPKPEETVTEFYLLGEQGQARDYPRELIVGQPTSFNVGITNREGVPLEYRVEVRNGGALLGRLGPVRVESGKALEERITIIPTAVGSSVGMDFLLYKGNDAKPYREARLWLRVSSGRSDSRTAP